MASSSRYHLDNCPNPRGQPIVLTMVGLLTYRQPILKAFSLARTRAMALPEKEQGFAIVSDCGAAHSGRTVPELHRSSLLIRQHCDPQGVIFRGIVDALRAEALRVTTSRF